MEGTKVDLKEILVVGAGELGMALLWSLAPKVQAAGGSVSVLVSPKTANPPPGPHATKLQQLRSLGVKVVGFNLGAEEGSLAALFQHFPTVVNCSGFVAGRGTQLKITRAVLQAKVERYFPWQFGVDYDIVGRGSGQPVFDEQYEVRQILRSQEQTEWVIVSTGMFMSFLFEPAFGVVDLDHRKIRALGSWDTKVTVTTPEDIGKLTTEILLFRPRIVNQIVYVAGDTLSYGEIAELLENVTGHRFEKEVRTLENLRTDLAANPEDVMAGYRAAFALGDGMWWEKAETFNARNNFKVTNFEEYLRSRPGQ